MRKAVNGYLVNFAGFLLFVLFLASCADNVEKASRLPPKAAPLSVVSILPESDQADAKPDGVFIKVNKSINIDTLANSIIVTDANDNPVEGKINFEPSTNTISFIPSLGRFSLRNSYTVNVTDGISNATGEALPAIEPWSFTVRDGVWGEFKPVEGISGVSSISQFFLSKSGKITLLWFGYIQEAGQYKEYFSVKEYYPVTRTWDSTTRSKSANLVSMQFGSNNTYGNEIYDVTLPMAVNDTDNITLVGVGINGNEIRALRYLGKSQTWEDTSVNLGTFSLDGYSNFYTSLMSLHVNTNGTEFVQVDWTEYDDSSGAASHFIKSQYFDNTGWKTNPDVLLNRYTEAGAGKSAMSKLGDFIVIWQQMDNSGSPIIAARTYLRHTNTLYPELPPPLLRFPAFSITQSPSYAFNKLRNVAMDSKGNAYVYWFYDDPSNNNQIFIRVYEAADPTQPGKWLDQTPISPIYPNTTIYNLTLTIDGDDNAIVTWVARGIGNGFVFSNVYSQINKSWLPTPESLLTLNANNSIIKFQKNRNNELVLYWRENRTNTWSRTFRNGAWTDSTNANDIDLTTTGIFTVEDATGSKIEVEQSGGTIVSRLFE